jgi:hypothetical protein
MLIWDGNHMIINPHELLTATRRHLAMYVGRLMAADSSDDELRSNFEKVFDARS